MALSALPASGTCYVPLFKSTNAGFATFEISEAKQRRWLEQQQRGDLFLQDTPPWRTEKVTSTQDPHRLVWSTSDNFTSKVGPVDRLAG